MQQVNIYEAKTRLSELVELAHNGESVIIAKAGTPMARLVPLGQAPKLSIPYGAMKGEIRIAEDFDAPLSPDVLAQFLGEPGKQP